MAHRLAKTHVVELAGLCRQTRLDIAQTFAIGELREGHHAKLFRACERSISIVAAVALHDALEARPRQKIHDLHEQRFAGIHGQPTDEERARQEQELQERRYADLRQKALSRVVSAVRDDRALTIQQLLQEELTPQILGHIVDIIQDDMNGDLSGLMSRNQQSRFYRSINHPEVFGQKARHIVSSHEPPPHPMNLAEASTFVRDVAEKWLLQKAGVASNRKSNGRDKM